MTTDVRETPARPLPQRGASIELFSAANTPAERLARGGGWWTFSIALVMLLALTEALNAAAWTEGLSVVRWTVLGGAVLSFLLSLTRWAGVFPALYSLLASLAWVAILFNRFVLTDLTAQESIRELVQRNGHWITALINGTASADNLIFVTQLAFLGWWIGYLALWSLMRHQSVLQAVLPAGAALLVNAYFAPQSLSGYVILYLVAVLLLAIRIELARNEARWQLTRVRYAPDIALDFLRAGLFFSLLVVLLAWAVPDMADKFNLERVLRPFEKPWQTVEDTWNRMYRALNYGQATTVATGFGKTLTLGGPVALTDRPIFDAESPEPIYWRAATYDIYTSLGWLNSDTEVVVVERNQYLGEPLFTATAQITTTVYPRESGQEVIFGASSPLRVSVPVNADALQVPGAGRQWSVSLLRSRVRLDRDTGYQVGSALSIATVEQLRGDGQDYPQWIRDRYLQIPDSLPARVSDLALRITTGYPSPYDKAEAVEAVLRTYKYNTDIAAPPAGADAVDHFLFESKEGYCDYYASAMVMMLRASGVPARLIVGYTPGETAAERGEQDESGQTSYRVLERNAHAWPDVYFPTYGWIQFEPTASEPLRVRGKPAAAEGLDAGLIPATPQPAGGSDLLPEGEDLTGGPAAGGQSAFQRWLVGHWGWLLAALLLGTAAAGGGWLLRRQQAMLFQDRAVLGRLFALLGRWAGRLRVPWPASHTPLEHAAEFNRRLPEAEPAVDHLTALYVAQEYGKQPPAADALDTMAADWQTLQPRLWRRWLAVIIGQKASSESIPGTGKEPSSE